MPWTDEHEECCRGQTRLERTPSLHVEGEPTYRQQGDMWLVSCRLRVEHECGLRSALGSWEVLDCVWTRNPPLDGRPGLVDELLLTDLQPRLFTHRFGDRHPETDAPRSVEIESDESPTPPPTPAAHWARFKVRLRFTSVCGETLDVQYIFGEEEPGTEDDDNASGGGRRAPGCLPSLLNPFRVPRD